MLPDQIRPGPARARLGRALARIDDERIALDLRAVVPAELDELGDRLAEALGLEAGPAREEAR